MTSDSGARLIGLLGAVAVAALVLATLLPSQWVPRTGWGWQGEHFVMYFATTLILCLACRRPCTIAMALMAFAGILEALQGLTPDRFPDLNAVFSGACGVISAATLVILLIRARRWLLQGKGSRQVDRARSYQLSPRPSSNHSEVRLEQASFSTRLNTPKAGLS